MECSRQSGQSGKALRQAGAGMFVEKQEGQCDWSRACVREIVGDDCENPLESCSTGMKFFKDFLAAVENRYTGTQMGMKTPEVVRREAVMN